MVPKHCHSKPWAPLDMTASFKKPKKYCPFKEFKFPLTETCPPLEWLIFFGDLLLLRLLPSGGTPIILWSPVPIFSQIQYNWCCPTSTDLLVHNYVLFMLTNKTTKKPELLLWCILHGRMCVQVWERESERQREKRERWSKLGEIAGRSIIYAIPYWK